MARRTYVQNKCREHAQFQKIRAKYVKHLLGRMWFLKKDATKLHQKTVEAEFVINSIQDKNVLLDFRFFLLVAKHCNTTKEGGGCRRNDPYHIDLVTSNYIIR